jgi:hypothetical protein
MPKVLERISYGAIIILDFGLQQAKIYTAFHNNVPKYGIAA